MLLFAMILFLLWFESFFTLHLKLDMLMSQAVSFSNLYAPEHLIVNVKDADKWEGFIENAGTFRYC